VLIFVDDSTQTVRGKQAMAIGCVVLPTADYNTFCRAVYRIKQDELGAQQLTDKELKGNSNFAKAAFVRRDAEGSAPHLRAVDRMLGLLEDFHATMISVSSFDASKLRTYDDGMLPAPYCELTWRLLQFAKRQSALGEWDGVSCITLDQTSHKADQRAGVALQNYFTRTQLRYQLSKYFVQVPSFTHSSLSPGLQAADLLAYLACQQLDPSTRPELQPYWERFSAMEFHYTDGGGEQISSCRPLDADQPMFDLAISGPGDEPKIVVTGES